MGNAPSSVPYGAQSAQAQTALSCEVADNTTGIILPDSQIVVSVTAPLYGGTGQNITFSDLAGTFDVPLNDSYLTTIGFNNYAVQSDLTLTVTNAAPSSLVSSRLDHLYVGGTRHVKFPYNFNRVLGTVNLIAEGLISDLAISELAFDIIPLDSNGFPVDGQPNYRTICRPVNIAPISASYEAIISSTVIDYSTEPQAPSTGVDGSFPLLNGSYKSVVANIPILCTTRNQISASNAYNLSLEMSGPTALTNGQSFSLTNVDTFVTVPGDILAVLSSFFGGTTAAGFVDLGQGFRGAGIAGPALEAYLDNASPSSFDIARDFTLATEPSTARPLFTGRYYPVGDNKPIVFPLPNFGSLTFSGLKAGDVGYTFSVEVPRLLALISVSSSRGQLDGSEVIDCNTTHPFALLRAPILAA